MPGDELLECLRCGRRWVSRKDGRPVQCPRCRNPHWDKPRKRERVKLDVRLEPVAIEDLQLNPESVDCIITDPPYNEALLPLCRTLLERSAIWLKPSGSLLIMVGQFRLPELFGQLNQVIGPVHYQWTLSYLTPGGQSPQIWPRKVNTFWKPILWYVKGDYQGRWHGDVVKSPVNDNDKRFHEWGQSERGIASLVEKFTLPKQMILDPFLGGGTTGVVAHRLGRHFIGADKDPVAMETARKRIFAKVTAIW